MSTSISDPVEVAVVGAGIAGVTAAWALKRRGASVVLLDRSARPATGGSGAAGAFIAPKIGRGGPLQRLSNEAFAYAHRYYRRYTPEYFHATGVLRLPRPGDDLQRFRSYEPFNHTPYEVWEEARIQTAGYRGARFGYFFPEAGDADAPMVCRALARRVVFRQMDVRRIRRVDGLWSLTDSQGESLRAVNVILATGHRNDLIDCRYLGIKGLWGSRGDYRSTRRFTVSVHREFSLSSSRGGVIKIGATHVKDPDACMRCDGAPTAALERKAAELAAVDDLHLLRVHCGMRAGSRDYRPVAGPLIDVQKMLEEFPQIRRGAKAPILHHEGLYILNGLGGRGFVFAPLLSEWLAEGILSGTEPDERVHPDRLFLKWVRKLDRPD